MYHIFTEGSIECLIIVMTKKTFKMMKLAGWKYHYFKSVVKSMMGHGSGVTNFHQFFDKTSKILYVSVSIFGELFGRKGKHITEKIVAIRIRIIIIFFCVKRWGIVVNWM